MDAAAERHPEVRYEPLLIDATYAGLLTGRADAPLVIPSLNRDGDLLSDFVLPLYGSIAGAESVLLALDDELRVRVAMSEAPHGTAPALEGKDIANPMGDDPRRGGGPPLRRRGGRTREPERASRAIYDAVMETAAAGIRTPDLKGHASTTEFTDAVIERVRAQMTGPGGRRASLRCRRRGATRVISARADDEGGLGRVSPTPFAASTRAGALGELEGGDREPVRFGRLGQRRAAGQRVVEGLDLRRGW